MHDFQQRKKIRKRLYSREVVILLAIVAALLLRGAIGVFEKERESRKNVEEVTVKLEEARLRHAELSSNMAAIQTKAGIEREIRERYSVTKRGEKVVVLIEGENSARADSDQEKGFWASLKEWFRGLGKDQKTE